ncbi:hypothetical protein [Bradymonas sediminis]|uniref:Uncharacterized protein n=1 Tax=Bradymonas sediminis TaxID=1548548 RepID=A0A2Z4FPT6_9DELT|nr:hypothetical protein [Bradymonas sediminis]AWV91071.1 hypothetical protein DN745_17730 [Bradymonas sediminis]TDP75187.1 hypothetical protein DFR33_10452 [Bradymonas sediminis]
MKKIFSNLIALSCALVLISGCDSKKETAEPATEAAAEKGAVEATDDSKAEEKAEGEGEAEEAEAGQWIEVPTYELKLRVPEDWVVKQDDQGVSASSPDDTTMLLLVGSKSEGLTSTMLNELRPDLKFKELEVEKVAPAIINGMAVSHGQGTAVLVKSDMDQEIQFLGYSIKRTGDQVATLFIFSQAEMYEAKKDEIQGIAQTLIETAN